MIEYKMMNEELFLCKCMHGGPVFKQELGKSVKDVDNHVVQKVLKTMVSKYQSCAVLTIDTDLQNGIVGVLWFYPSILKTHADINFCIQDTTEVEKLRTYMDIIKNAPLIDNIPKDQRTLDIECLHVVLKSGEKEGITWEPYYSRGIGKTLVKTLITWAQRHGWKKIYATAIPDIKPLRLWWGAYTLNGYQSLGFKILSDTKKFHPEVLEGVLHMKQGKHGDHMKKMWEEYSHVSDTHIATTYKVVYEL
jgi:GNAT superfamily N-acetyltransferase